MSLSLFSLFCRCLTDIAKATSRLVQNLHDDKHYVTKTKQSFNAKHHSKHDILNENKISLIFILCTTKKINACGNNENDFKKF